MHLKYSDDRPQFRRRSVESPFHVAKGLRPEVIVSRGFGVTAYRTCPRAFNYGNWAVTQTGEALQ
jgi:hypothetical protein